MQGDEGDLNIVLGQGDPQGYDVVEGTDPGACIYNSASVIGGPRIERLLE